MLVRLPESEFLGNRRGGVDRDTCRTPHFYMYSHSTDHTAQTTCVQWLKTSCAPKSIPSSTRHGSPFAARDTEHFLTVSLFYLSCVVVVFSTEPRLVVHESDCPLRRPTAGWHFYGIHLLHWFVVAFGMEAGISARTRLFLPHLWFFRRVTQYPIRITNHLARCDHFLLRRRDSRFCGPLLSGLQ